jgi:hypothetical protein
MLVEFVLLILKAEQGFNVYVFIFRETADREDGKLKKVNGKRVKYKM